MNLFQPPQHGDGDPATPQCRYCNSIITRACAILADFGELISNSRYPSRDHEFYDMEPIVQGETTNCHDCALIASAIRCCFVVDISSVELTLKSWRRSKELEIILRVHPWDPLCSTVSVNIANDTRKPSTRDTNNSTSLQDIEDDPRSPTAALNSVVIYRAEGMS